MVTSKTSKHLLRQIDFARDKIVRARRVTDNGYDKSVLTTLENALSREHPMLKQNFKEAVRSAAMDNSTFNRFTQTFVKEMADILCQKGLDYSDKQNRLINFVRIADRLDLPVMQVFCVYLSKHYDSICTFCRDGDVHSEPIRGRFLDLANYALLGAALVESMQVK